VIIKYEVHGKIVKMDASYDNRFISVITIEDRKIVNGGTIWTPWPR
jgi:ketosteroid isomerase-like protein